MVSGHHENVLFCGGKHCQVDRTGQGSPALPGHLWLYGISNASYTDASVASLWQCQASTRHPCKSQRYSSLSQADSTSHAIHQALLNLTPTAACEHRCRITCRYITSRRLRRGSTRCSSCYHLLMSKAAIAVSSTTTLLLHCALAFCSDPWQSSAACTAATKGSLAGIFAA